MMAKQFRINRGFSVSEALAYEAGAIVGADELAETIGDIRIAIYLQNGRIGEVVGLPGTPAGDKTPPVTKR